MPWSMRRPRAHRGFGQHACPSIHVVVGSRRRTSNPLWLRPPKWSWGHSAGGCVVAPRHRSRIQDLADLQSTLDAWRRPLDSSTRGESARGDVPTTTTKEYPRTTPFVRKLLTLVKAIRTVCHRLRSGAQIYGPLGPIFLFLPATPGKLADESAVRRLRRHPAPPGAGRDARRPSPGGPGGLTATGAARRQRQSSNILIVAESALTLLGIGH